MTKVVRIATSISGCVFHSSVGVKEDRKIDRRGRKDL